MFARQMIVGEEHPACRHHVFSVMHLHGRLIGYNGRDQFSIGRGSGVRIDHREKVIAFLSRSPVQANMKWPSELFSCP